MELHFKYFDKVQAIDDQLNEDATEEEEDEMYLTRLSGGLFSLQLVDYILLEVCASGAPSIKQRVQHLLNLRSQSVTTIRDIMREYAGNLGDKGTESEDQEEEKQHILQLLDKF